MIRVKIRRSDGMVVEYECDTERDLHIVQRVLENGHVEARSIPASPAAQDVARPMLEEGPRKILMALLSASKIEGKELRQKVGITDAHELGRAMLVLSNRLLLTTGKRLDEYVERRRTFKRGERIKVYKRTKAGEKLIQEMQAG